MLDHLGEGDAAAPCPQGLRRHRNAHRQHHRGRRPRRQPGLGRTNPMPITPTEKIWMNGELVPWDEARVHVLTHSLHYGMGVFEGIRAYETDNGPGVFRLTDHIERLFRSAAILGMEIPYTVDELVQATKDTVASTGPARLLHPPDRLLRLRRDGAQHAAVLGRRVDRLLAVGRLPRRRRPHQGRAHEDQQLDAPRPQHDAARGQDHRQLRELLARQGRGAQGRLRRGDHAQRAGPRVRVHRREHLRGPRRPPHHPAAVGRRARGHHPGHRHPDRQGPRLRGRVR